jgi:lysine 2,3-aminomutase
MEEKRSNVGIAGIMNDQHFNLVPEGLQRLNRRKEYNQNPTHTTLKDKRGKRDELKEKKFQALQNKPAPAEKNDSDGNSASNE